MTLFNIYPELAMLTAKEVDFRFKIVTKVFNLSTIIPGKLLNTRGNFSLRDINKKDFDVRNI